MDKYIIWNYVVQETPKGVVQSVLEKQMIKRDHSSNRNLFKVDVYLNRH